MEGFPQLLKGIPQSKQAMKCADQNLPETNSNTNSRSSENGISSLELFEEAQFSQAIEFENILNVAF